VQHLSAEEVGPFDGLLRDGDHFAAELFDPMGLAAALLPSALDRRVKDSSVIAEDNQRIVELRIERFCCIIGNQSA
jgi:hypothetical protein